MSDSRSPSQPVSDEEARLLQTADFAWDLVAQLVKLRMSHDLTQAELAQRIGTRQQAISRMEDPMYDRQNLRTLRAVGDALDSFVDVIYVPRDKLHAYVRRRYLPTLEESADETVAPQNVTYLPEYRLHRREPRAMAPYPQPRQVAATPTPIAVGQ